jgi:hypothetical protein
VIWLAACAVIFAVGLVSGWSLACAWRSYRDGLRHGGTIDLVGHRGEARP